MTSSQIVSFEHDSSSFGTNYAYSTFCAMLLGQTFARMRADKSWGQFFLIGARRTVLVGHTCRPFRAGVSLLPKLFNS